MNNGAHRTLEFEKTLKALGTFTSTAPGRDKALSLVPSTDIREVKETLRETSEASRLLSEGKEFPLGGMPDIRPHLQSLQVEHQGLDVSALAALAQFAGVAGRVKSTLPSSQTQMESISKWTTEIPDLGPLGSTIEKAIDLESLTVKDTASPELRSLRARIFKLKNRLLSILESYLRQKDSRKILQEQIITERNGRAVLLVRSECRGQLVGIVHGTSSSGATLFIEPLSTVELNNDVVSLVEQERQEIERILLALTNEARACSAELGIALEALSHLDLVQAKALLSNAYRGCEPRVHEDRSLRLESARHPLLVAMVAERAGEPIPPREAVPISLQVNREKSALVITGPNTGGKTVALKTAGLLSLMVQAGLHVPVASESAFPVFKGVFADIGDEQSIGSSLSTFSAHLRNIVEMEQGLQEPSLVLLDEVGTGTDPAEGGALGTALVEHFRERGALVLASTHHGMLKTYAATSPGVGSASFQFDPQTYEPTYQLVEGATGRSLAFEMALRLGLPEGVVRRARELQNEKERQVEDLLGQLETDGQRLARDQESLAQDRRELDEAVKKQRVQERQFAVTKEEELRSFQEELRGQLVQARREIREILENVRTMIVAEPSPVRSVVRQMEVEADRRLDVLETELVPETEPRIAHPVPEVHSGMRVTVSSLGLTGVVVETFSHDVEVVVRDKRLRIPLADLEPVGAEPDNVDRFQPPAESRTSLPERKEVPVELNVIGCTVDEAIQQADKFLDDAFLSEHRTVRLIHGLGTGRLRTAIHEWLSSHPHVTSHQAEGSGAVTVVELKV